MYLESQEKIKKPKTVKEVEDKEKQILDKMKKSRKKFLFKLLLFIFLFILIILIGIILFFYFKKEKQKVYVIKSDSGEINKESLSLASAQKKLAEEKDNSITAVYSLKKAEESVFFNPDNIGLSDKNYEIEVLSVKDDEDNSSTKNLRHLEDISYKFISQINGKIEIRISFYVLLTSMFVDFSNLDGSNLINLNSAFENCGNLEFANLTLMNGEKIQTMDNSFNGCQKLKNIDLTKFEPKQNVSLQNTFKNCVNLNYVDLSNFHSYNFGGIFIGCVNLVININTQQNSDNKDINELFNNSEIANIECEIGPGQKCKSCLEGKHSQYCDDCNEGYYMPCKKKKEECIKCEENCLECFGLVTFSYCFRCKGGFELINGKCEKNKQIITDEVIDQTEENEKNEERDRDKVEVTNEDKNKNENKEKEKVEDEKKDNDENKEEEIEKDKDKEKDENKGEDKDKGEDEGEAKDKGGDRDEDTDEDKDKNKEKEEEKKKEKEKENEMGKEKTIENRKETEKSDTNKAEDEKKCTIGPNEKCKSCDINHPEFCGSCNEGYYLSEDDKTICSKCSMRGCRNCPNNTCLIA